MVEAEKKINEKSDDAGGMFYLEVDSEGYLLLKKEVIKMLPEDQRNENAGCGDHKHMFYSERISTQAA